jgi:hypothetical protein
VSPEGSPPRPTSFALPPSVAPVQEALAVARRWAQPGEGWLDT